MAPPSTAPKSFFLSEAIHEYISAHSSPLDPLAQELVEETARATGGHAIMQVAPEQGLLMGILAAAIGAKEAVEVGVFTGFSALCVARALPADGTLLACDVSEEWTSIGKPYWEKAGVAGRIDLRIAPAAETLSQLPEGERFDFGFIDADKTGYPTYFEEILRRMRPGGLLLVDNVLWFGKVADPNEREDSTLALRAFNDQLAADERVDKVMLAVSDGLTVVRKR